MFRFLLAFYFLFSGVCAFSQASQTALMQAAKAFDLKQNQDILNEEEDIKKLVLKYASAPANQKETIKKEIIKLQTKKEEEALARQEKRIERQEEKIKQLKEELKQDTKNKEKNVKNKVAFLLKEENIKKIKEESLSKKIKDKAKDMK
ncbi:MAG: hypothetical protein II972_05225 [Elusimicrobiaceae bacterium]|nr:hypothetical protein [Elusimicrobiaceae bacterium]MBQ6223762.1 hypothetical protein [Campylobacter sp.]